MSSLDAALVIARLVVGVWLLWRVPTLRRSGLPLHPVVQASAPGSADAGSEWRVTVIVPARNEAANLPGLLASLSPGVSALVGAGAGDAQGALDVSVIVVDDGSEDATRQVVAGTDARLVAAAPPPDGWIGKSWACAEGVREARRLGRDGPDDVLVFVDADVRFDPGALGAVVAAVATERTTGPAGLVSVQPFHEPGAPIEHLAALCNVVSFAAIDAASPTGRRFGARGAFGPVLATTVADHDAVGGHAAVAASVVDDVALAERYRDADLPVRVLAGRGAVRFRMYPEGFGQMVAGFTKNLAAGASAVRRSTLAATVWWVSLLVQATLTPVIALLAPSEVSWSVAAGLYAVVAVQCWWMARRLGRFGPLTALAFPATLVVFLAVFARSAIAARRGEVHWRGRTIRL